MTAVAFARAATVAAASAHADACWPRRRVRRRSSALQPFSHLDAASRRRVAPRRIAGRARSARARAAACRPAGDADGGDRAFQRVRGQPQRFAVAPRRAARSIRRSDARQSARNSAMTSCEQPAIAARVCQRGVLVEASTVGTLRRPLPRGDAGASPARRIARRSPSARRRRSASTDSRPCPRRGSVRGRPASRARSARRSARGRRSPPSRVADRLRRLEAAHLGHLHVHQHDVERRVGRVERLDGLAPVLDGLDLVAALLQQGRHQLPVDGVVFGDAGRAAAAAPWRRRVRPPARRAARARGDAEERAPACRADPSA